MHLAALSAIGLPASSFITRGEISNLNNTDSANSSMVSTLLDIGLRVHSDLEFLRPSVVISRKLESTLVDLHQQRKLKQTSSCVSQNLSQWKKCAVFNPLTLNTIAIQLCIIASDSRSWLREKWPFVHNSFLRIMLCSTFCVSTVLA